ncbi:MAG: ABC transporter transmembrane domain-containing protein, partial [Spirochaeta sp.]
MEHEKILSGYNHTVMKRLLAYARPHRIALALAMIALFAGAAGQLSLPVIIQRAVDRHMVRSYIEVKQELPENADSEYYEAAGTIAENSIAIGDTAFITRNDLQAVPGIMRDRLTEIGILGTREYQVFPHSDADVGDLPDEATPYVSDDTHFAVSSTVINELTDENALQLRRLDISALQRTSMVFLGILVVVLVAGFSQVYLMTYAGQSIMRRLRMHLFSHTIKQNMQHLNQQPVGRMVNRLTNDVETINQLFTSVLITIIRDIVMMFGVVIALLLVDMTLGFITIITLLPVLVVTAVFRRKSRSAFR